LDLQLAFADMQDASSAGCCADTEDMVLSNNPGLLIRWAAARSLLFVATSPATLAAPSPVIIPCTERDAIIEPLRRHYGEQRRGLGLTVGGQILEIFVSKDGHWSALLSYADGSSCMIAAGEGWLDEPLSGGEQS
jgi:hypothetical protein